jgi:hypothetical protein
MNTPRDVDLADWLDGIGFKPANTEAKQLGHEAARQLVGRLGQTLHYLLPPGRDKSLTFTHLEDVLMRANRALALGGGPNEEATLGSIGAIIEEMGVLLPEDPRIEQYKAEQRGETPGQEPLPDDFQMQGEQSYDATVSTDDAEIKIELTGSATSRRVQLGVTSTPERVKVCQDDASRGEGPKFTGFYAGFTAPDHLSAFLREVAAAGQVAFGDPRSIKARGGVED